MSLCQMNQAINESEATQIKAWQHKYSSLLSQLEN